MPELNPLSTPRQNLAVEKQQSVPQVLVRAGGLRIQPSPFNQRVSEVSIAWAVPVSGDLLQVSEPLT